MAEGDAADVDLAVKAARKAFEDGAWRKMDARDRGRLINKLADLIEEEADELAALESLDNGKPIRDAQGRRPAADDRLPPLLRRLGRQDPRPDDPRPRQLLLLHPARAGRRRRADHPLELPDADGGLEMGPGPGRRLHDRHEAGRADAADLPAHGPAGPEGRHSRRRHQRRPRLRPDRRRRDRQASGRRQDRLHRRAARPAQIIMRDAAPTLKRLTFELGGKSPNIVFADADLDAAVAGRDFGLYFNQGQCCCAGSRLFVEEKVYDKFVEKLAGDEQDAASSATRSIPTTEQGPQVDQGPVRQDHALHRRWARRKGPSCVTGGKRHRRHGLLHRADAVRRREGRHGDRHGRDLRPGDVGPASSRTSTSIAARPTTRSTAWPPPSGPATSPRPTASPTKLRAGTVWINCYDVFDAAAPFGGFKMSGMGRELGEEGLEALHRDEDGDGEFGSNTAAPTRKRGNPTRHLCAIGDNVFSKKELVHMMVVVLTPYGDNRSWNTNSGSELWTG